LRDNTALTAVTADGDKVELAVEPADQYPAEA
jgi:hypothetical protein